MSTYIEAVDDLLLSFREHNEQKQDINANYVFWKLLKALEVQIEVYLQRLQYLDIAPQWARKMSGVINGIPVTSGEIPGMLDPSLKLTKFTIPSFFVRANASNQWEGILNLMAGSMQKQLYLERPDLVMQRIKARHPSLEDFHYGFIVGQTLYVYPFTPVVQLEYIPKDLWETGSRPDVNTEIPYPPMILDAAMKSVEEELQRQQQRPADDKPDMIEENANERN